MIMIMMMIVINGEDVDVITQVAQARYMSIGEHRHCCVTFKI